MDDLQRRFNEDLARLKDRPVVLSLNMLEAWAVMGQLQLACRHPGNNGVSRRMAEQVARLIQRVVATTPALAEVAEMGWDPDHDAASSD